jgi:tRNA U55 pseudouridine synthase TruB
METKKYRVTLEFDIYVETRDNEGDLKDIADVHTQAKFKAQAMANRISGSGVTITDIQVFNNCEMKSINF